MSLSDPQYIVLSILKLFFAALLLKRGRVALALLASKGMKQ